MCRAPRTLVGDRPPTADRRPADPRPADRRPPDPPCLRRPGRLHKLTLMGVGQWMRVLDTVGGLIQMSGRFRRSEADLQAPQGGGPLGQLETRLAGVVVAALKEAFDRDRARMDLERSQMEAERARAEEALRAELRRQASERALGQLRMIAVMAFALVMVSAALGVWLPGMRTLAPRLLMGFGWISATVALGCAFVGWQHVSAWTAAAGPAVGGAAGTPDHPAASAAPWLLLGGLALTGISLLTAL